jgi:hypothetical protein
MEPPNNTVAIIADIRNNKGIYIHETQTGDYIDGVGTKKAGKLIIVPWIHDWHYYSIGTLRIRHITKE